MTDAADWSGRVGDAWAMEWRRTDRSFAGLAMHLNAAILHAAPAGSSAVLDIGCGAGATSAALISACPDLSVMGIDLSAELIAVARTRVPTARFSVADAARDPIGSGYDLLVSRHGVMFFADPVAAFVRLRAVAVPGGRLVFSSFRARRYNAFAGELLHALTGAAPVDPPAYAPGPFAFAEAGRVATILTQAGWAARTPVPTDFDYVAGEGDDPVADAASFLSRIGPVAAAIAASPVPAALRTRLPEVLRSYRIGDRVALPASAWIWQARA